MTAAYTSDLTAANRQPPVMKRPRIKNVSEATRALHLEHEEPESSLSPSHCKEARYACGLCGTRSTTPEHELCRARQNNGKR